MGTLLQPLARLLTSSFLLLGGIALSACANTSTRSASMPAKEAAAMNTHTADAYRPHALDEYPELTPEEVGRRVLKLIDGLKSFDDLSLNYLREVTQLPLANTSAKEVHAFAIHLPESDWYYNLWYYESSLSGKKSVNYKFDNKDPNADMGPVCGLDFNSYVTALKQMGFKEGQINYHELGHVLDRFYIRGNVSVNIYSERQADAPEEKLYHACIKSIGVGKAGE